MKPVLPCHAHALGLIDLYLL
ncbi:hypothetical protein F383_01762 [Gossypium arboreum]|uniref:Uncharacterized protein n=1 Tax=Gossypium arboreum TaxID=29729 RepID=A0A0B0PC91_GOSAR|nr:hypothetical protein F383_01762 [Gossypium arboreum]